MNYEVLNSAIEDITWIVNQYKMKKDYDESLCKKLVLSLFGYYMAFGPDIFKKIGEVLDATEIHQCSSAIDLVKLKEKLTPLDENHNPNPCIIWNYQYNPKDNKFTGAIPIIAFFNDNLIVNVFDLAHELSHALEGTSAEIINETHDELKLTRGLGTYIVEKKTNGHRSEGHGMTELITMTIENKILREYLKIDESQITNQLVKNFISKLRQYKDTNVLLNSYGVMSGLFKDLIDNEDFFSIVKRNYYNNQQRELIEEFDSLDERLNFKKLILYADRVESGEHSEAVYYAGPIQKQLDALNEKTGAKPDKRILILI